MQAIVETLFDAVYLTSVIAIGVTMIVKSRGNKEHWLFGIMAVVLGAGDAFHLVPRALALCTTGLENFIVPLGIGKFITSITMTIFYIILYYVWRVRYKVNGQNGITACPADRPLLLPSECMAERQCAAFLGHLPEHSLCAFGPADHRLVLQERPASKGPRVPQYVADHCAQFRFLHSRGPLGRRRPYDWDADDPQDLRLCLDGPDRLQGHECQHRDLIKDTAGCLADSRRYLFHFWTAEVRISRTGLHSVHLPIQIGAPLL